MSLALFCNLPSVYRIPLDTVAYKAMLHSLEKVYAS